MSQHSSQRSQRLEDPFADPLSPGGGVAVARLRALRDRQHAVDEALAATLRLIGRLLARAGAALERSRQRRLALRDLRALDDHLLADIGLSRPLLGVIAKDLARARPSRSHKRSGRCERRTTGRRQRCGRPLTTCTAS
ncbi:MAG: DUF1127 domain-containing protein [Kiloniellales bacterium]